MTFYRHSFEVVGATWFADLYCAECADKLPEVDPEGNPKHPIFLDNVHEFDDCSCGSCGSKCSTW